MILKLTTNNKASIWVNLSRILQMTGSDLSERLLLLARQLILYRLCEPLHKTLCW